MAPDDAKSWRGFKERAASAIPGGPPAIPCAPAAILGGGGRRPPSLPASHAGDAGDAGDAGAAARYPMRSMTVQFACPPPSHMVCIP